MNPVYIYVSTTQAAFYLQLSQQRVRKLAKENRIKGAIKKGNHWKIPLFKGMPQISSKKKGPKYYRFLLKIRDGTGRIRTGDLALQIGVSFPTLWTIPSP